MLSGPPGRRSRLDPVRQRPGGSHFARQALDEALPIAKQIADALNTRTKTPSERRSHGERRRVRRFAAALSVESALARLKSRTFTRLAVRRSAATSWLRGHAGVRPSPGLRRQNQLSLLHSHAAKRIVADQ